MKLGPLHSCLSTKGHQFGLPKTETPTINCNIMFLLIDKLQTELPAPKKAAPNPAAALHALLGGKYGEMSTLGNYFFQSFRFRSKSKLRPFYKTLFFACIATASFHSGVVLACDEPGTPNNEAAAAIGHKAINYFFDNTARVDPSASPGDYLKLNLYFDIEMKERGTPDSQGWAYIENDGPHPLGYKEKMHYTITVQQTRHINDVNLKARRVNQPLVAGKTYCLRVWCRVSPNGCRSKFPSSWQCVTVNP